MAGRGCNIFLRVHRSSELFHSDEHTLPVALHSPLSVLKDHIVNITGIPYMEQQVALVEEGERSVGGVMPMENEWRTLREYGVRDGSVVKVQPSGGFSVEYTPGETTDKSQIENAPARVGASMLRKSTLATAILARQADHSYNGILFDVTTKGPYCVSITSISVAGMLGRVRVFAKLDSGWKKDETSDGNGHYWAEVQAVCTEGWYEVADVECQPSWDRPCAIPLDQRFSQGLTILPHRTIALYVHSGLPDDLGIQYQSYDKGR